MQGETVGLIDSTGSLVVEYNYDAWGRIIGRTGSLVGTLGWLNPFRYRGYVYDEETRMYYLKSRYYNPEWGRFINADALLGKRGALLGHNLFAYCYNNPAAFIDSNGAFPIAISLWRVVLRCGVQLLTAAGIGIAGGMLTDALIDSWTRRYPTFETFPQAQVSISVADVRSREELESALGAASTAKVSELDGDGSLDAYYFAFISPLDSAYPGHLMCINEPLSLEEAKTVLKYAKLVRSLAKKCGTSVEHCGIYTFDQSAAEALAAATGGGNELHNHYYTNKAKGTYYNHYHSGSNWGGRAHIWFGIPLIRQ